MSSLPSSAKSSQNVTLPEIAELFDEKYLDLLLPVDVDAEYDMVIEPSEASTVVAAPKNPMIEALKETTNHVRTDNNAPALASTLSATLDAFNTVSHTSEGEDINKHLSAAWAEDPKLTLRIIWCLRSIPDGKGNRQGFYRAFGWLYEHHPRTAISNLHLLAESVVRDAKTESTTAHGYWKDLLNILAMATLDELTPSVKSSKFLNPPRMKASGRSRKEEGPPRKKQRTGVTEQKQAEPVAKVSGLAQHLELNAQRKKDAKKLKAEAFASSHAKLTQKLTDPKYRALYITVTRLFGERIVKDLAVLAELKSVTADEERLEVLKSISLAGKWAPTPACSHDRVTNLSSAIALFIYSSKPASLEIPKSLEGSSDSRQKVVLLRQFYGHSILKPLRVVSGCPEPLMAGNRWTDIKYARVSSTAMKKNSKHFFQHDPTGFEKFLIDVESGKKKISGATLFPHEILSQVMELKRLQSGDEFDSDSEAPVAAPTYPTLDAFKKKMAETELRVAEAQWKTLVSNLKEAGKLENSIAICDVSGSMGSFWGPVSPKKPDPIYVSVALSLILASIAAPPFNGGFITFSEKPQYITLDLEGKSLAEHVDAIIQSDAGYNTDFNAVFMNLLLPLAIKNNIKQEDMIKRLFVFSDMQFDEANRQGKSAANWETNYDVIAKAYQEAGYEVPQIVFWDLNAKPGKTVEVTAHRKGVAMMNGFSQSLLKVFMGEVEEGEAAADWEEIQEDGTVAAADSQDEFNPVNVMKKALMKESFNGLKVVD